MWTSPMTDYKSKRISGKKLLTFGQKSSDGHLAESLGVGSQVNVMIIWETYLLREIS